MLVLEALRIFDEKNRSDDGIPSEETLSGVGLARETDKLFTAASGVPDRASEPLSQVNDL